MNFLFPALLGLGGFAAAVIVIHLTVRSHRRPDRFPAARFVPVSDLRHERRITRDDWLLMLLRSLLVLLIAAFAAMPVFQRTQVSQPGGSEIWLVDTSMSMFETDGADRRPMDRVAAAVRQEGGRLSRLTVIACDASSPAAPRWLGDTARQSASTIADALEGLEPSSTGFDLHPCAGALRSLQEQSPELVQQAQVKLLSDFRGRWLPAADALPQDRTVEAVAVTFEGERSNRWFTEASHRTGQHGLILEGQLGGKAASDLRSTLIWDRSADAIEIAARSGALSAEILPPSPLWRARWMLPDDALNADNTYWLAGERKRPGIVIVRDALPGVGTDDPTFFLTTALQQLQKSGVPISVDAAVPERLPAGDHALAILYDLPAEREAEIAPWLAAHPNMRLVTVAGPAAGRTDPPRPIAPWPGIVRGTKAQDVRSARSPTLTLPDGTVADAAIERILVLGEVPADVSIVARWGDDPLLLRDARGSYLLTTLDLRWARIAASRWMVPLAYQILDHELKLSGQSVIEADAGAPILLPGLTMAELDGATQQQLRLSSSGAQGVRGLAPGLPGFYPMGVSSGGMLLVVQPDRQESRAEPNLTAAMADLPGGSRQAEAQLETSGQTDLSRWAAGLAVLLAALEIGLMVRSRRPVGSGRAAVALALLGFLGASGQADGAENPSPSVENGRVHIQVLKTMLPTPDRQRALELATKEIQARTSLEFDPAVAVVDPAQTPREPLLWLPGCSREFPDDARTLQYIRQLIGRGGLVVAEDCSRTGQTGFRKGLERFLTQSYPDAKLRVPPDDHTLYRSFYLLNRLYGAVDGSTDRALQLGSHERLLYVPQDMTGGLVGGAGSKTYEFSVRSWVNVMMYALSLDYKSDMIHLPFILKRRNRWAP